MDDRLTKEVCRLLKNELKRCGISYKELAKELGISEVSVKRLLNQTQSISFQRLALIATLVEYPLSKLISKAEDILQTLPLFNNAQDLAFVSNPALFTFWSELVVNRLSVTEVAIQYNLNQASTYRYLRLLESVNLIQLGLNNQTKLLVPGHTAFDKGAHFPSFFTQQRLESLQERVLRVTSEDNEAFLISLKAELTANEFQELNTRLVDWMFTMLKQTMTVTERIEKDRNEYTFGFMAAKGSFGSELPPLENFVD
ncbi:putative transcriptional regulator [Aliivibrio wodanis]|uniref:Putative transcriptional regulator n=1 Tax=Aliivibrio wodanis TaxID=80852 RepID=A0A090IKC6_9GAMM|nr:putative transcriptional regulator [Aliivibrio wodanis]